MDYQLSTSVKIDGIPLLPPLATNNIFTEINYYKQLAAAVQERLKILEIAKQALENNKNESVKDKISMEYNNMTDPNDNNQENLTQNITLIEVDGYPTKENTQNLIDIDIPGNENNTLIDINFTSEPALKKSDHPDKSASDEDKSCLNDTLLGESVSSDTVTASTDLNQYLNTSISSKTDTIETPETTPENCKPQVPKTLDIVPMTIDQTKSADKLSSDSESTPKLVRQGSYVLEAPSPMLLAHIQNEITNSDYTPSSSAQSIKRKEWNLSETKSEWKSQGNFKEPILSRSSSVNKLRRNSSIPNHRLSKSVSNSKTGSPLDECKPTKSVDCIQAMFAKEYYSSKIVNSRYGSQTQKISSFNGSNNVKNNNPRKNKSTSILNLANKLGTSLKNLGNNSPKPVKRIERKNSQSELQSNSSVNSIPNSVKSDNSSVQSKKDKPVVTSEKIVTVFKEIQDTHKKQMLELMTRQQKEQLLMQENFKRQQIVLLAQIRKSFPEISILALSEAICGKSSDQNTNSTSKTINEKLNSKNKIEKSKINGVSHSEKDKLSLLDLPVDYNHPSRESTISSMQQNSSSLMSSNHSNNNQATQTFDNASPVFINRFDLSNVRDIDEIPVGNPIRRHSSVSRQLFPLDSKTNYAALIDNSTYTEKHVKAATTINAYAKGFLVRRLMKTEKVIALKNTYREALHCMLRLHVDAPLNLSEVNFHKRLQLQCDAASVNIVELFSSNPIQRMEIIAHDREIKKARSDRPSSARSSYSFATQRTLARKKMKEMGTPQNSVMTKSCPARTRCQTWGSNSRDRRVTTSMINHGMKRSTSAGAVRKPWR